MVLWAAIREGEKNDCLVENTPTHRHNPLRMNRDARASSPGLSRNCKPFSVSGYQRNILKRERRERKKEKKNLQRRWDDPDMAIVETTFTTTFQLA